MAFREMSARPKIMDELIDVKKVFHLSCPNRDALFARLKKRALKDNRLDDANEEVIKRRLATYEAESKPVLEYYRRTACNWWTRPSRRPKSCPHSRNGVRMGNMSQPQFENFTASSLYCEKCKAAMPVRERLLLVLPDQRDLRLSLHRLRVVGRPARSHCRRKNDGASRRSASAASRCRAHSLMP